MDKWVNMIASLEWVGIIDIRCGPGFLSAKSNFE